MLLLRLSEHATWPHKNLRHHRTTGQPQLVPPTTADNDTGKNPRRTPDMDRFRGSKATGSI